MHVSIHGHAASVPMAVSFNCMCKSGEQNCSPLKGCSLALLPDTTVVALPNFYQKWGSWPVAKSGALGHGRHGQWQSRVSEGHVDISLTCPIADSSAAVCPSAAILAGPYCPFA